MIRRPTPLLLAIQLLGLIAARAVLAAPQIEFSSADDARAVLEARDEFVERMSAFDRAARVTSARDVSEREYLAFAGEAPLEWTRAERERVAAAFAAIEPALAELLPPLDEPILLIKTTGAEEGGAGAYTRGGAVILPESTIRGDSLERTLAHEIFHVLSRSDAELRRELYALIGFEYCGEISHPGRLAARRMTNPDAPVNDHCILIEVNGSEVWAVPILYAREPRFDPASGRGFFDYLTFEFLLVDRSAGPSRARPIIEGGRPVLVPIERVSGFFEQVGRNTSYVIHPEEILASNFAMLALGDTNRPSPDVLERLRRVMTARASHAGRIAGGAPR